MITEDETARAASGEQEYEELASSIGLEQPAPVWTGVGATGCLAAVLGVVGFAIRILAGFSRWNSTGSERAATGEGIGQAILIVAGVLAALGVWLIVLNLFSISREAMRRKELAEAVAKHPKFAAFYEQWCRNEWRRRSRHRWSIPSYLATVCERRGGGAMITEHEVAQAANRGQEYEKLAQSIGLPDPPAWRGVWITGSLVLVLVALAVALLVWILDGRGNTPYPEDLGYVVGWGVVWLVVCALALVLLIVCLVLIRRTLRGLPCEQDRQRKLTATAEKDPHFMAFYKEWCEREGSGSDDELDSLANLRPPRL